MPGLGYVDPQRAMQGAAFSALENRAQLHHTSTAAARATQSLFHTLFTLTAPNTIGPMPSPGHTGHDREGRDDPVVRPVNEVLEVVPRETAKLIGLVIVEPASTP